MIVVDTNLVVYLLLRGDHTDLAERVRARHQDWVVPRLWRSEFRNVLAREVRLGRLALDAALDVMADALALLADDEYEVDSTAVLRLAAESGCTAYDCEFVALAQALHAPLVTQDRQVLAAFPGTAVALDDFGAP